MADISKNVHHLSDAWAKEQTSNNAKMLAINEFSIDSLKQLFGSIDDCIDIFQSSGKTLDYLGASVGQKRGELNDEQYRTLILYRIAVNTSGCDYQTVINNIMHILGCEAREFRLTEEYDNGHPATCKVTNMPYAILDRLRFGSNEVYAIIKRLIPIAVALDFTQMDGTFEFCEVEEAADVDNIRGFADDELTIGGTWSMLVGEDHLLPIE